MRGKERKAVPEFHSQKGIQIDAKRLSSFQVSNTRLHGEK
jgi:hypothetical protein